MGVTVGLVVTVVLDIGFVAVGVVEVSFGLVTFLVVVTLVSGVCVVVCFVVTAVRVVDSVVTCGLVIVAETVGLATDDTVRRMCGVVISADVVVETGKRVLKIVVDFVPLVVITCGVEIVAVLVVIIPVGEEIAGTVAATVVV